MATDKNFSEARNPATGEVIGTYPLHDAAHVREAIARSREAQRVWAALPFARRRAAIDRMHRELYARSDEIASIISANSGKTRVDALATEVLPALMAVRYYRSRARGFLRERRLSGGNILMFNKPARITYRPYGVVGIISPWNYPFAIPFSEIVMGLLAGNGVILKVASDSLAVGKAIDGLFGAAGLPPGLFAYVNLPGKEAGEAFISGGVDKLFFTGSTEVGKVLMERAAKTLTPVVLELGGNDAAVICKSADLDRAVWGVLWAGFANAGQSCGGIQRVYAERSIYEPFLKKLCAAVKALRVGKPDSPDSDIGCMANRKQKETVEAQIKKCLDLGARVAATSPLDAELERGNYVRAMVLTSATPDMPVISEEIFGPVVAVIPFDSNEEAVSLANDSVYGLTASVWSRDKGEAWGVARRLMAGAVMINDHLMSHGLAETPWGGFGASGIGRSHGEIGFMEMVQPTVLVDETLPLAVKNIWWHPYSARVYSGLRAIIQFLYSGNPLKSLAALPRLLGLFFRYWER